MQLIHHTRTTSTAALSTTWCFEAGHAARSDTNERQALWYPGGAEEDSRFRVGDRHRRLLHNNEEDNDYKINIDTDYIVYSDNGGIDDTVTTPH